MSEFKKKSRSKKSKVTSGKNLSLGGGMPLKFQGTKSWINSSTLISTGNRDLDSILGGGQSLQTSLLIEEDRFSDYGMTFARYWGAEGVANAHGCAVVDFCDLDGTGEAFEAEEFIDTLPLDANLEKTEKKKLAAEQQQQEGNLESLGESETMTSKLNEMTLSVEGGIIEEENEDDEDEFEEENVDTIGDDHLKVAYRYKTGNSNLTTTTAAAEEQQSSTVNSSVGLYCHSFDLSSKLQSSHLEASPPSLSNLPPDVTSTGLVQHVIELIQQSPPNQLTRILLRSPPFKSACTAVPMLVNYIRRENLPVAFFITVQPNSSTSSSDEGVNSVNYLTQLKRASTIVLRVDSFSSLLTPPAAEYRDYVGIFTVGKIGGYGGYIPRRPVAMRWGLKRDRRKMHVKMLNLPPEEYSERGGSVGSGVRGGGGKEKKNKSTPGLACSSNLEF